MFLIHHLLLSWRNSQLFSMNEEQVVELINLSSTLNEDLLETHQKYSNIGACKKIFVKAVDLCKQRKVYLSLGGILGLFIILHVVKDVFDDYSFNEMMTEMSTRSNSESTIVAAEETTQPTTPDYSMTRYAAFVSRVGAESSPSGYDAYKANERFWMDPVNNNEFFATFAENKFADKSESQLKLMLENDLESLPISCHQYQNRNYPSQTTCARSVYRIPKRVSLGKGSKLRVFDQGINCRAGYAIATTTVVLNATGSRNGALSPQAFVCDEHNHGCHGGRVVDAIRTLNETSGPLFSEEDLPYTGNEHLCLPKLNAIKFNSRGLTVCCCTGREAIRTEIASGHLAILSIPVFRDFFFYKSGIYRQVNCSKELFMGYQPVVLAGYRTENNSEYFLGLNSWGTDWGENGYFKLLMDSDMCAKFSAQALSFM